MARRRRETNAEIATTTPERRGNRTPDFLRPNEEPAAKVADAEQRSAAATSSSMRPAPASRDCSCRRPSSSPGTRAPARISAVSKVE